MDERADVQADWLGRLMGIPAPWRVVFAGPPEGDADGYVEVRLEHGGAELTCPKCGGAAKRHDARKRVWRDLDLHSRKTRVVARVPRAKCPEHGVLFIPVPWADRGSRFTALFEQSAIELLRECSISAAASRLGISWDQASAIQCRAVRRGMARREAQSPRRIGVDETSFRKRHRYVTLADDLDSGAVPRVSEGRSKASLDEFFLGLTDQARNGIEVAAMDMHDPYIRSVREMSDAEVAFDKFHVAQHLSKGIDQVRRQLHRELGADAEGLKRTRFLWLRNPEKMAEEQQERLNDLCRQFGKLGRAWSIKEWAMTLWHPKPKDQIAADWRRWIARTRRCRLNPMIKVAKTMSRHLCGIVTAAHTGITNARSEGVNSKVQWIKRMARGYRNIKRFSMAILFHLGMLDLRPNTLAFQH